MTANHRDPALSHGYGPEIDAQRCLLHHSHPSLWVRELIRDDRLPYAGTAAAPEVYATV